MQASFLKFKLPNAKNQSRNILIEKYKRLFIYLKYFTNFLKLIIVGQVEHLHHTRKVFEQLLSHLEPIPGLHQQVFYLQFDHQILHKIPHQEQVLQCVPKMDPHKSTYIRLENINQFKTFLIDRNM